MNLNKSIFREYDIRGIVKDDFSDEIVRNLGRAFGTYMASKNLKTVCVSGDIRESSIDLKNAFIKGLVETGSNVTDIGILPTPVNYFSIYHMNVDAAVQITGSHNPAEFNGFKFSCKNESFYGKKIQILKNIIIENKYSFSQGTLSEKNIIDEYINMLISKIKLNKKMKVIIDCGNACGCITVPKTLKKLGVDVTELYSDIDSSFPNHHPDPTVDSNLNDIISHIKKGDYDLGMAFDGDADRIVVVDGDGNIIRSDNLISIFLPEIISEKNKKVIFDVKCSEALEKMIIKNNGIPMMWKTGHSLIKDKMKKEGALFAGEMSGHIFFADEYFGYDDALYVGLRLLRLLSKSNFSLSDLNKTIPKYQSTPEMRLECIDDEEKFKITDEAIKYFTKNHECLTIDGVRIKFKNGWGLVRSSNTQPVIVCRFEAKNNKNLIKIKKYVLDKLKEFGNIKLEL